MKREKRAFALLFSLTILSLFLFSQPLFSESPLQVDLIAEEQTIQPGRPFWVALRLQIEEHWHSYWKNPGDSGIPTAVSWTLPDGFTAGEIEWPYPKRFDLDSLIAYGYEGETWLLTQITPSASFQSSKPIVLKAEVRSLVCSATSCLPSEKDLSLQLSVSQATPLANREWAPAFAQARAKLPKSGWSVQAKRFGDLIRLTVDPPDCYKKLSKKFQQVHFFPENGKGIDAKAELTFEKAFPNRYIVALKDDASNSDLKGILLFEHPEGKEAVAIHVPLENVQEIALADPLDIKKNRYVSEQDNSFEGGFFAALLLAFAGGFLLNLMPCVLPVISFKILSFVKMAGQSRSKTLQHGLAFSAGVIVSFWLLAGMLLLLQAYGHSVGWGFQLQEPLFIALLASLLLIFGLSLFGVFEMGISVMGVASEAQQKVSGLLGSFSSGILATAVATPCTGPFLGTAVGFAVTLPALLSLAIFTSVGVGMAAPYLVLTAYPSLLRFLPKPGAWMVTFKELMGFLMVGTVLWLTWVFGAQTSNLGLFLLLSSFFQIAIACWVYGKWANPIQPRSVRLSSLAAVLIFLSLAGYTMLQAAGSTDSSPKETEIALHSDWEPFSEERIADLQSQGIPVFVDFTAKWCLICQANHIVLSVKEINEVFASKGVVKMKADWTRRDPKITAALKKYGRNSVPLYLFYGANSTQSPQILPQVLTPEIVLNELTVER